MQIRSICTYAPDCAELGCSEFGMGDPNRFEQKSSPVWVLKRIAQLERMEHWLLARNIGYLAKYPMFRTFK